MKIKVKDENLAPTNNESWEERFEKAKSEGLQNSFIQGFCNDHGKIRWLRGAFYDEEEKLKTILEYLEIADRLLKEQREEIEGKIEKALDQLSFCVGDEWSEKERYEAIQNVKIILI
jgi:hypothetical protein